MWRTATISSALLLIAFLVSAQDTQTAPQPTPNGTYFSIPLDAAHRENPVKSTPESIARGKRQYGFDCAMCHAKNGSGTGDVAADMKLKMHDESDPATLQARTDGELFYIIKKGKDQMPAEGDRVKDETVWDMVNYIRTFPKKSGAASGKPAEEKPAEGKPADAKPADTATEKAPN
jgi:mono/diheme cytochrome c family protein